MGLSTTKRAPTEALGLAVAAVFAASAAACDEPSPPWAGKPDGRVIDESEPFLPPSRPVLAPDAGAGQDAGRDTDEAEAPLPEEELLARPAGRHGGMWMSCHDRFEVSGEPRRDVTRLALSCGPVTGMERASGLVTGQLKSDARGEHRFAGEAGHCYRVFAAAGDGVEVLDVRVLDGEGTEIARHQTQRPWAVVEPERPFCTTTETTLTVVVDARGGSGAFAAEVWSIPPRERGL